MTRDEYVKCIDDSTTKKMWCGRPRSAFEGAFIDVTHAALNGRIQGRLVACPECVDAVTKALHNGDA